MIRSIDRRMPPGVAELMLASVVVDDALRDCVVGDLTEEFDVRAATSVPAARLWYWSQVLRSAIPLAITSAMRGRTRVWGRLLLSMLAGLATVAATVVPSSVLQAVVRGVDLKSVSISAHGVSYGYTLYGTPSAWAMLALPFALSVLTALAAGYVTALAAGKTKLLPALILGSVYAGFGLVALIDGADSTPIWYQVVSLASIVPAMAGGGLLYLRGQSVHPPLTQPAV